MVRVVLISTYELGRQPFGLASPAAWLRNAGADVTCLDLTIQRMPRRLIRQAELVAFYVPMHTATRIAAPLITRVKELNPQAHLCVYGLYAPVNEDFLRRLGAHTILGGEFEAGLTALAQRLAAQQSQQNAQNSTQEITQKYTRKDAQKHTPIQLEPVISLAKQSFIPPDRSGLPDLADYACVEMGDGSRRVTGYTEASRGCKHLCRHCPIVPVYNGRFRIVPRAVVLEDIRRQVDAGAEHITFGDPDFFNGPGHALPLVEELHAEFPDLTYDVTIKVEHLLQQENHLSRLARTGCLFVTSAVESVDDSILTILDKGHTRADFIRAVDLCGEAGLILNPTFVTFTPWTTLEGYLDLLSLLRQLDLVEHCAPIQYAIRLLIPAGSRLLELEEVRDLAGPFDPAALVYPWRHPDPRMDQLHEEVLDLVQNGQEEAQSRRAIFDRIWRAATAAAGTTTDTPQPVLEAIPASLLNGTPNPRAQTPIPHLSEPWYC